MKTDFLTVSSFYLIILCALMINSCSDSMSGFRTVQSFADSSGLGKMYFAFVETNDFDTTAMQKFGRMALERENTLRFKKDNLPVGVVIHFYNLKDTATIEPKMLAKILRKYPNLSNAHDKIFYIENAYIYTAFSRKLEDVAIPQHRLFKSEAIVPKEGIDIRAIMKKNDTSNTENPL